MWIALALTASERAALGELLRVGPYSGVDEVVCAGLWALARQLDLDLPIATFALGRRTP